VTTAADTVVAVGVGQFSAFFPERCGDLAVVVDVAMASA